MCVYKYIYTKQIGEHRSSVLVRLAINVIFAFHGDALALNALLNLRDKAIHVLLVSADQRDSVPGLAPSRVTVILVSISISLIPRRCIAYLPTLTPSGSTFLANSVR